MKIWFALITLIVGVLLFRETIITIPYSYTGNKPDIVQQGLDTWLKAGYKFVRTNSTNCLVIIHTPPTEFQLDKTAVGENVDSIIRISTTYPFTSSDLVGLVSHEAGHYLRLPHNSETNSVMNPDLPLSKRPSTMDTRRVKWNKFNFLKNIF
ncbi:MAG: hypothetical protein EB127_30245 [Alphaproteobacteria bacterium]|nr:hypothetical protein [Alphaproteobacteria bacterium]